MPFSKYDKLLETVHASAAFELLRAGLSIGLFEILGKRLLCSGELSLELNIADNRMRVLINGLLGIGFLEIDASGKLKNCVPISQIIQRDELPVLKNLVRFQAEIVAVGQRHFTESLISNQNEGLQSFPGVGDTIYARLSNVSNLQSVFFEYMQSYTAYASRALIQLHDFTKYRQILDVGGGGGALANIIANVNPGAKITLLDTEFARKSFDGQIHDLLKIDFKYANIHSDTFPPGNDLVIFAHQLVIWSPDQNIQLIRKAFSALRPGGTIIIFSSVTDDDRQGPLMTLLDSVYFQSVASGWGEIYSFSDYREWLSQADFMEIFESRLPTWTPHGVVVAKKPNTK